MLVHTDLDPDVGIVEVIPQEFSRVLLNLLNNAFYATREQAKQASNNPKTPYQPQVWVKTSQERNGVIVSIRDNGTGVTPNLLGKIFQPFFTTKPTGQGVGLGLSLSYDVITKGHGGQLDVQSEPGQFTEFTITLPKA